MEENKTEVKEEKTLKQLKEELVSLGMPADAVESFNTKSQLLAVINTMKAKETVKRVDTLEEKEDPKEEKLVEQRYRSKAIIMRDKIMAQPTIRFFIPCEGKEKPGVVEWRTDKNGKKYQFVVSGTYETVQLSGFKYFVPKGVFVDVPQQIAEELGASLHLTSEAGKDKLMDRTDPQTGRPINEVMM